MQKDCEKLLLDELIEYVDNMSDLAKEYNYYIFLNDKIVIKSRTYKTDNKDTYIITIIRENNEYFWNIKCKNTFKLKYEDINLLELTRMIIMKEQ